MQTSRLTRSRRIINVYSFYAIMRYYTRGLRSKCSVYPTLEIQSREKVHREGPEDEAYPQECMLMTL